MGYVRSLFITLTCALCVGCTLSNMTPQARFQDAAHTLNDAARWGQVDVATRYVSPAYMEVFLSRHREWGERISIADADVTRMKLGEDRNVAMSEVALNWYDTHGITTRTSVITQQWEGRRGSYVLVSETVRSGDPRIFAPDAEPENATSGDAAP